MRSSCLPHPSSKRFFLLREELIEIVDGDHCAAALIALLEYYTNGRIAADSEDLWIRRSWNQLSEDLFKLYGRKKIGAALTRLSMLGFIESKQCDGGSHRGSSSYRINLPGLRRAIRTTDNDDPDACGKPVDYPWSQKGPGLVPKGTT